MTGRSTTIRSGQAIAGPAAADPSSRRRCGPSGAPTAPCALPRDPDPAQFAAFGTAIAQRYSGTVPGLPRVRLFEAWNEPNASFFLLPALVNGQPYRPQLYRAMVNAFSAGRPCGPSRQHRDRGRAVPVRDQPASAVSIGPYRFMREVLCLSEQLKTVPGCGPPLAADVWSHHPYTSGGPTHRASNRDAISLGDMLKMKRA